MGPNAIVVEMLLTQIPWLESKQTLAEREKKERRKKKIKTPEF